jgi:hypothetical protein
MSPKSGFGDVDCSVIIRGFMREKRGFVKGGEQMLDVGC